MAYNPKIWKNDKSGKTPIDADELNRMEKGIANAVEKNTDAVVTNVVSRNLANIEDVKVAGIDPISRTIYNVKPNTKYTFSLKKSRISGVTISSTMIWGIYRISCFDNTGTQLSYQNGTTVTLGSNASAKYNIKFTTPANTSYVVVRLDNNNGDTNVNTLVSEIQLEEGEVASDFTTHLNLQETDNNVSNLMKKIVFSKTTWGNGIQNTGISVNAGDGGKAYLICYSTHTSSGDNTNAYIGLLRCGYNGNNYSIVEIIKNGIGFYINFSINNSGILQFQNGSASGASKVSIYALT